MKTKSSNGEAASFVSGDPGVGGLLADPLASDPHRDKIDPGAGQPSADPAPPRHHHDWAPNKQPAVEKKDIADA